MIREEDVLALQTAVLQAAVSRTVPGQKFLELTGFREFVDPGVDDESLREMLRELVNEGVLQSMPGSGGEISYCASQEFLTTMAGAR